MYLNLFQTQMLKTNLFVEAESGVKILWAVFTLVTMGDWLVVMGDDTSCCRLVAMETVCSPAVVATQVDWSPAVTRGDSFWADPVVLLMPLPGVVRVFPTDPGVAGLLPGTDNLFKKKLSA